MNHRAVGHDQGMKITPWLDAPFLDERFPLPTDQPFSVHDARREGLTARHLTDLVEAALLRRPVRGVYLATQAGDSPRLRAQCIRLAVPDDAVLCDRHAGWLHGAEMVLAPNEHLHLQPISVFRPSGRGRLRNDLVDSGERALLDEDITEVDGIPVTTRVRTAWDLGRQRYLEPGIAGLDAMLRLGGFDREQLIHGVGRFRGQRWVTHLRLLTPLADGGAASPGESVLRLRWIAAGLPEPSCQVEVFADGALLAVLDIANEELRYSAEYDGAEWHSSPDQRAHDRWRRARVAEHAWIVDPFVKADVFGVHADAERMLREGARRARLAAARRIIV